LTRRLPALLAVPVLAAALASGCADEAAAARVGDTTISNDDLMSEVKATAGSEALLQAFEVPSDAVPGQADADKSYSQQFVGFILQNRVIAVLREQLAAKEDIEVTESDLDDAEARLSSGLEQSGGDIDDLPKSLREQLTTEIATAARLEAEFGSSDDVNAALGDLAREIDIEVSSKYGSWDPSVGSLVPPDGPVGATDSTTVPGDL
jgi:hypothetical protein